MAWTEGGALVSWETRLTEGGINQPGLVQTLRQSLARDWNGLVETAQRFDDHHVFLPRRRRLRYCCVEQTEFVERAAGDGADAGSLRSPGSSLQ